MNILNRKGWLGNIILHHLLLLFPQSLKISHIFVVNLDYGIVWELAKLVSEHFYYFFDHLYAFTQVIFEI